MAEPNCEKCIHKAVCDNYEQWIGDITGFENIRATKCPYFQESGWISVEDRLPAVSVVEVVRCETCNQFRRYTKVNQNFGVCRRSKMEVSWHDFCSYGEREDKQNETD